MGIQIMNLLQTSKPLWRPKGENVLTSMPLQPYLSNPPLLASETCCPALTKETPQYMTFLPANPPGC